ncbi:MAG: glycosyltransferase family 87 protein [Planctomycetota bacterium]
MQRPRLWWFPVLLAVLVAGGWYYTRNAKEGDRELPVYVHGGERMAAGEEIYRRAAEAKPFTYPPFAAVPFVPFAQLPASWQPAVWFAVTLLMLLPILVWLQRWLQTPWPGAGPPRAVWAWVLAALVALRHVSSVFENQSHDLMVFAPAALAIAWCGRGGRARGALAGLMAGAAAAFKATPLLFLVWFVPARAWWAAATLVLGFALLSFAPDLLWPRADGGSWLLQWIDVNLRGLQVGGAAAAEGAWNPHGILNQSLSGTLTRLLSPPVVNDVFTVPAATLVDWPPGAVKAAILTAQLAVVAGIGLGVLWLRRGIVLAAAADPAAVPLVQRRGALGAGGLVLCGMVLLSPMSSKSHFCVLLAPAVFCADRLLRGRRDVLLACLFGAAALLATGSAKGLLGRQVGNLVLGLGAVTWSTVLLMLATLRALRPAAGVIRYDAA